MIFIFRFFDCWLQRPWFFFLSFTPLVEFSRHGEAHSPHHSESFFDRNQKP